MTLALWRRYITTLLVLRCTRCGKDSGGEGSGDHWLDGTTVRQDSGVRLSVVLALASLGALRWLGGVAAA